MCYKRLLASLRLYNIYIIRNICSLNIILSKFFENTENVSFENTSGRLNRISNDVSGSRCARHVRRNDFDDVKILK